MLDASADTRAALACHLSAEERDRARRFALVHHRERFVTGHGTLRRILASYLGILPAAIRYESGAYGKPSLAETGAERPIQFNFSHSSGLALCAVTCAHEVGVDVERVRPTPDWDIIAERFFSARECAALRALPVEQREDAFYACWTRKEAYVKGWGRGLSMSLDSFDVSVGPAEAALLGVRDEGLTAKDWSLHALQPAPGFEAALAVEGDVCHIRCWRWSEYSSPW